MDNPADNTPISPTEYKRVTEEMYKQNLELARLYKEVESLNENLQKANEGQSNLIHIMNHQIKGYLSKSRNIFSELLSETDYRPASDEAQAMISEGFNSLTEGVGFIQQVLNGSSAESGQLQYMMAPINFETIVKEVAEKQKDSATAKNLNFDVKILEGNYETIGDNIQLRECVRNLIDNSIQYTLNGGLTISLQRTGDNAELSIQDTGVGISEEDKKRLFTIGGRGRDSLKINVNSTGYGLAFVKAVVEAHKGRVWVESEGQGKGSTFYLELPVVKN